MTRMAWSMDPFKDIRKSKEEYVREQRVRADLRKKEEGGIHMVEEGGIAGWTGDHVLRE